MTEQFEADDAVETIAVADDGTVVDTVVAESVAAVVDEDGGLEELVSTRVVDTEISGPDGSTAEILETDVVEVVLDDEGDVVAVLESHEVDTVVVDVDGEVTEVVASDTVVEVDGAAAEVIDVDVLADTRLEALDDGSAAVAGAEAVVGSPEALPFEMPARERFAALVDVEVTGEPRVDAATARLDEVPDLPTSDHVEVYEDVHRRLQDALSDTEVR